MKEAPESYDRPHAVPRVSRFLLVATGDELEPRLSRDKVPGPGVVWEIVGDSTRAVGWGEVRAAGAAMRARADAGEFGAGPVWVWVLHDQFFYRTEWAAFACFGPAGWVSRVQLASAQSAALIERKTAERREAEKAATRAAVQRRKATGEKKLGREVDAIAAVSVGDDF